MADDVNCQEPPGSSPPNPGKQKSKVAPNTDRGCKRIACNSRVARAAVKLLRVDQGLEKESVRRLPRRIQCGQIRSAIRSTFSEHLTPVQELSIKSAQKLESAPCESCESATTEGLLRKWKESRFRPAERDDDHLSRFKKAFACLVPQGWNRRQYPYFPNGSATFAYKRREGGNWNHEGFSSDCRVELVYSSGKPRVVTLYSGYNVAKLTPLHHSLYGLLRREGWLLVGSPTDEKVLGLDHGCEGPYVSVDYSAATDNIKTCYVQAMVEVLTRKSVGLTVDEKQCLQVLANLTFDRRDGVAQTGQPMGSPMSFPLLCLINKAVVDLALADLLERGEISAKQFVEHRCLINGDDLLFREPTSCSRLLAGILHHGSRCGLIINEEKTMVDPEWAEVNSTAFYRGRKRKKTNVGALKQRAEVTDPIGFLADSVVRRQSFISLLRQWKNAIASAETKIQGPLPPSFWSALYCAGPGVKDALMSVPTERPKPTNPFPVVPKPAGYALSRECEVATINDKVARLKQIGYKPSRPARGRPTVKERRSIVSQLRLRKTTEEDNILKVLADRWELEQKEMLVKADDAAADIPSSVKGQEEIDYYEGKASRAQYFVAILAAFNRQKKGLHEPGRRDPPWIAAEPCEGTGTSGLVSDDLIML